MKATKVGIKEGRIPCCGKGCPQRDNAEHEGYAGVLTDKRITENNNTDADSKENRLLERILSRTTLTQPISRLRGRKARTELMGWKWSIF